MLIVPETNVSKYENAKMRKQLSHGNNLLVHAYLGLEYLNMLENTAFCVSMSVKFYSFLYVFNNFIANEIFNITV